MRINESRELEKRKKEWKDELYGEKPRGISRAPDKEKKG